jgi:branched-chain amino acid transport system substrate-binding protein
MKKLIFISFAVILVTGLALAGCGGTTTTPGATTTTAAVEEIRIGAIASLTGMNAMTGAEHVWAYNQAVADINAKGGVMVSELGKKLPIRLIFEDDKSEAAEGAATMERLIKLEGVSLVFGTNITPINIAAGTVAEKYKVYLQINTTWLDDWKAQKFQWATDLFTSAPAAAETPYIIWDTQSEADRPQRPAILMEDNPDGQGFGGGFRASATKYGYTLAADEAYTPGTKDFSSTILKFKQANVDAILWLGSPTDSITLIRQIKEQGLNVKYIHGWKGFWPTEFYAALGEDSNYLIHDGFWAETLPYPGAAELGQKFKDSHGGLDSVSIGLSYANVQIMAQAIEKAGSLNPAKVRDVVYGGSFPGTVNGDVKYDADGTSFTPLLALQWWEGKRMPVYPAIPNWQLKWLPPWSER